VIAAGERDADGHPTPQRDLRAAQHGLKQDPSLRFSAAGRTLLRWLSVPVTEMGTGPARSAHALRGCGRRTGPAAFGDGPAVPFSHRRGAVEEAAAVDPDHHRLAGLRVHGAGPDVEVEAVFALLRPEVCAGVHGLDRRVAEGRRIEHRSGVGARNSASCATYVCSWITSPGWSRLMTLISPVWGPSSGRVLSLDFEDLDRANRRARTIRATDRRTSSCEADRSAISEPSQSTRSAPSGRTVLSVSSVCWWRM
jgi:hypothetical protein